MRPVVVTGRGVVSPLGVGFDAHWQALVDGRCGIAPIPRLESLGLPSSRGGEVGGTLIEPHASRLPRKQQKLYSRATSLAILAGSLAMEDAGLGAGAGDPERFGVLLGVSALWWDLDATTAYVAAAESSDAPGTLDMGAANAFCMRHINPLDYSLKTLPNLAAGHVAIAHDAQGLCRALVDGRVGGAHAIGQAYRLVAEGELDVALCGGTDAAVEPLHVIASWSAGLLASDARDRAGAIPGEGSGVLVLEDAARAERRGARIHGRISGYAAAAGDGVLPCGADRAVLADRIAGVLETLVGEHAGPDVVSLCADGVDVHDRAEREAVTRVFGRERGAPVLLAGNRPHGDLGPAAAAVDLATVSSVLGTAVVPVAISTCRDSTMTGTRSAVVIALGMFGDCAGLMLERP